MNQNLSMNYETKWKAKERTWDNIENKGVRKGKHLWGLPTGHSLPRLAQPEQQ